MTKIEMLNKLLIANEQPIVNELDEVLLSDLAELELERRHALQIVDEDEDEFLASCIN